jgi:DNA invertase Pin-like site-specific DNA recombinase
MAKIGYARVSTRSQKDDSQVDGLTACGCDKIFVDKASGKFAERPELDKALACLHEGDAALADELRERGVGLVVLRQDIDTTTPAGCLVFHILGAIDEFQHELIIEGAREGLEAAGPAGAPGAAGPS